MLPYRMRISLANVVSRTYLAFQSMKDCGQTISHRGAWAGQAAAQLLWEGAMEKGVAKEADVFNSTCVTMGLQPRAQRPKPLGNSISRIRNWDKIEARNILMKEQFWF